MKLENAKPCPFCGCEEIVLKVGYDNDGYCRETFHYAECNECKASTQKYHERHFKPTECKLKAVESWNKRV